MMFKVLRQLNDRREFSIFTNAIKGETLSEIFKNNYCDYYMSKFDFKPENPFLKLIGKQSSFTGAVFHQPIILEEFNGKKSTK